MFFSPWMVRTLYRMHACQFCHCSFFCTEWTAAQGSFLMIAITRMDLCCLEVNCTLLFVLFTVLTHDIEGVKEAIKSLSPVASVYYRTYTTDDICPYSVKNKTTFPTLLPLMTVALPSSSYSLPTMSHQLHIGWLLWYYSKYCRGLVLFGVPTWQVGGVVTRKKRESIIMYCN